MDGFAADYPPILRSFTLFVRIPDTDAGDYSRRRMQDNIVGEPRSTILYLVNGGFGEVNYPYQFTASEGVSVDNAGAIYFERAGVIVATLSADDDYPGVLPVSLFITATVLQTPYPARTENLRLFQLNSEPRDSILFLITAIARGRGDYQADDSYAVCSPIRCALAPFWRCVGEVGDIIAKRRRQMADYECIYIAINAADRNNILSRGSLY